MARCNAVRNALQRTLHALQGATGFLRAGAPRDARRVLRATLGGCSARRSTGRGLLRVSPAAEPNRTICNAVRNAVVLTRAAVTLTLTLRELQPPLLLLAPRALPVHRAGRTTGGGR